MEKQQKKSIIKNLQSLWRI